MYADDKIGLVIIGRVRTGASEEEIKAKRRELVSQIDIFEEYADALDGVEGYSHLYIIFWMHKVPDDGRKSLKVHPRGRLDFSPVGVFASRGRNRPNPIGMAVVELIERSGATLKVKGLDAMNGTPVLDLKPLDFYDIPDGIKVPFWWLKLLASRTSSHGAEED